MAGVSSIEAPAMLFQVSAAEAANRSRTPAWLKGRREPAAAGTVMAHEPHGIPVLYE